MQMKNNTAQATKVITAHVPLPMADKVDQMAARLEALDDVTSGQVIDHQAVQAWADSLSTDNPLPVPR
ncbi:CopG family transcriptional regulator [Escherichia coli]|nr:CopG family transcriptional regulator [Escherichia coli]